MKSIVISQTDFEAIEASNFIYSVEETNRELKAANTNAVLMKMAILNGRIGSIRLLLVKQPPNMAN